MSLRTYSYSNLIGDNLSIIIKALSRVCRHFLGKKVNETCDSCPSKVTLKTTSCPSDFVSLVPEVQSPQCSSAVSHVFCCAALFTALNPWRCLLHCDCCLLQVSITKHTSIHWRFKMMTKPLYFSPGWVLKASLWSMIKTGTGGRWLCCAVISSETDDTHQIFLVEIFLVVQQEVI